jgi:hypothetical protein
MSDSMIISMELLALGCAFLQESSEFPGIRRNVGSKKRNNVSFLQEPLEKAGQTAQ